MPAPKERTNIKVQAERTILAALRLPESNYDRRDPFGELAALAEQAGGVVVGTLEQHADRPVAGTYIGTGKVKELRDLCQKLGASLVIFDHDLSPRQIATIEEEVGVKILDRSELILDIFASRATTREAQLQVEIAQLEYTYPRLKAMWDHLERIVGTGGLAGIGTRGPGETQLEIDRRLVQRRKMALRSELEGIMARRRREVQQRLVSNFTVGIVGYTNAGKSTLFNTLTAGGAYADDRVFATLVTRTRDWDLGADESDAEPAGARKGKARGLGGLRVMLSDTVGFVRDLPHQLVASFRATLEEATHAHILLIVLDVSDPAAELQYTTVNQTLDAIFAEVREEEKRFARAFTRDGRASPSTWAEPQRIVLLNKVDRLPDNRSLLYWERTVPGSIPISAIDPAHPGHRELRRQVRAAAQGGVHEITVEAALEDSRTVTLLEGRGHVLDRQYADGVVRLNLRIGQRQLDQVRSAGGRFEILPEVGAPTKPARRKAARKR
jgi:GTP-binding protein HflX